MHNNYHGPSLCTDSSVDQFPELVIPVPSSDMTTACTSSYPSSNSQPYGKDTCDTKNDNRS